MKKKILLIAFALLAFIVSTADMFSSNGKSGRTGSPSETTCTGCHTGTVNTGPGSVTISCSNITNWMYMPGQTYHMTVTVAEAGITLFGLDVEALKSNNTNAGTLVITNSTETQILTVTATGRKNVVHVSDGGLVTTPGSKAFSFDWIAPSSDSGKVTFYIAGLTSNADASTSGDNTYTITKIVNSQSTVGLDEIASNFNFSVYPNPATDVIHVTISTPENGNVNATLYSIVGQKVVDLLSETATYGTIERQVRIPASVVPGTYFLQVTQNGRNSIQKIMIQ